MKEDFLHYLWKYKKMPTESLQLVTGEKLNIRSFGTHNLLSGPDFFNAQLEINGQLWAGTVEMHLKSSYWYAHRHETDKAYNNVILHVVWEHDVEVFDINQQPIPTLELKNQVNKSLFETYKTLLFTDTKFINCENQYAEYSKKMSFSWNERLFVERLEQKSQHIEQLLKESKHDWEKILFLLLLKNFGGKINGDTLLQMGKTFDFSVVRKEKSSETALEALFFGQSGLLTDDCFDTYFTKLKEIYAYLAKKYELQPIAERLQFSKLRPQGFPTIRLSQLAKLYHTNNGLFSKLMSCPNSEAMGLWFEFATSDYWETHYTFGKESAKQIKKISKQLLALIWINTIVPLKFIYAKKQGKDTIEALIAGMRDLVAEKNTLITHFETLGVSVLSAFDSQVLLQQYNEYCSKNKCLECAIGISILNKT